MRAASAAWRANVPETHSVPGWVAAGEFRPCLRARGELVVGERGLVELGDEGLDLGEDLGGVGGAGAQDELHLRGQLAGGAQQVGQSLLPGDPPDEDDRRAVGVDAVSTQGLGVGCRLPQLGIDAVVDDVPR